MKTKINTPAEKEFIQRVVALLSRGSLALRLGNFETEEDINAKRKQLADYKF